MKTTQTEKVLNYLKEHEVATSNELRRTFFIVDVPKAISILVSRGVNITSKRNRDNTSTYTYNGASTPIQTPKIAIPYKDQDGNEFIRYEEVPAQIDVSSGNDRQTTLL
jgi:hypothetical protein